MGREAVTAYYNEPDKNAAAWLRNLQAAGEIATGEVNERSIKEVRGSDLAGVRRAHFFAGIGGWDIALRLAGWDDERDGEVWTGSCPCQPFSSAGKGKGIADERHLWPEFFRLIAECRPATVMGEQVASKAGLAWLDGVFSDLEGEGFTCWAADSCAAGVGAPHIRQRLYWVADRTSAQEHRERPPDEQGWDALGRPQQAMAERTASGRGRGRDGDTTGDDGEVQAEGLRATGGLADLEDDGLSREQATRTGRAGITHDGAIGPWSDYRIIPCTDGKARRTGSRVFPLAHGIPRGVGGVGTWRKGLARGASRARIGMLKGSGNAIVPELAAEFVRAYTDSLAGQLQ